MLSFKEYLMESEESLNESANIYDFYLALYNKMQGLMDYYKTDLVPIDASSLWVDDKFSKLMLSNPKVMANLVDKTVVNDNGKQYVFKKLAGTSSAAYPRVVKQLFPLVLFKLIRIEHLGGYTPRSDSKAHDRILYKAAIYIAEGYSDDEIYKKLSDERDYEQMYINMDDMKELLVKKKKIKA